MKKIAKEEMQSRNEKMSFEDYLSVISQCLEKLEDDNLALNEGLALYREGMENLQKAQKILEDAQLQCEELKMQYRKEEQ